ncbi:MAG: glycosyltransferase [Clostridia bacterium]|nr:glycosyltransferase [Clostridia bacterium]
MNEKLIYAVVVTYNRKVLLREGILALLASDNENLRILVVDNAGTDGTKDYIADLLENPAIIYENTGKNLGGAGGFAYGIRRAVSLGAYYVWLMDDDCIVTPTALDGFLRFADKAKDEFGFLSGVVRWTDGSICKMNVQRTTLFHEISDFSRHTRVKLASFVSLFLTAKVIEEVGLPYREFFIWGDDWEYTARISKSYPCYLVSDSVAVHKSKNNIGADIVSDTGDRLDRYFYAYRNEGYFYAKEGLRGKLYYFAKKLYHRIKIRFSGTPMKKEKLAILRQGAKAAKTFTPTKEFVFRPSSKVKVLEFFCEPLSYGGQEAFMLNMARDFESDAIAYTFATPYNADNEALLSLIRERGYSLVYLDYPFQTPLRKIYTTRGLKRILKTDAFDVIHIQSGSLYALYHAARIAKRHGVKRVYVHSHAAGSASSFKYKLIKAHSDRGIEKYADGFLACSVKAAQRKFPASVIEKKRYAVINNGIDSQRYVFSSAVREEYRRKLGIGEDELTLCHIGRFAPEKNHGFLIETAKLLAEKGKRFRLLLIGDGPLKEEMTEKVARAGLSDAVSFLGLRDDIPALLMASDVFLFPSLFEGLGIVAIEAQGTGLPTLCSPAIPREAAFTDLVSFVDIASPALWADAVLQARVAPLPREEYAKALLGAHYDAKESAALLEKIYLTGQVDYE